MTQLKTETDKGIEIKKPLTIPLKLGERAPII
jgi:hypothetical protein